MSYLYVIGPVTGKPDNNQWEFMDARSSLQEAGFDTDIPHQFVSPSLGWHEQMAQSINRLLHIDYRDRELLYDGIAMLDGWEDSKGAKIEHDLAVALGIPCKKVEEWLKA